MSAKNGRGVGSKKLGAANSRRQRRAYTKSRRYKDRPGNIWFKQ